VEARIETTYTNGAAILSFKNDAKLWDWGVNGSDQFYVHNDTRSTTYLYMDGATSKIGIFKSAPEYALHVVDQIKLEGSPASLVMKDTGQSFSYIFQTTVGGEGLDLIMKDTGSAYGASFMTLSESCEFTSDPVLVLGGSTAPALVNGMLSVWQSDGDQPLIHFKGASGSADFTKNLVDDDDVSTENLQYWVMMHLTLYTGDNPDQETVLYTPVYSIGS
jgi:hypothetical protein